MKIQLIIVGKIENSCLGALADIYLRRITNYAQVELVPIKPEKIKNLSDSEILQREGRKILAKVSESDFVMLLDREGAHYTSEEFSQVFERLAMASRKRIVLLLGGPLGIAAAVKRRADDIISLSKMTFPHELAAVMVLEQIYRAFSILRGEKYHK